MIRALVTGFVQNWDVLCIQQLQQCKTPKAILTTYASSNLDETGENLHHTRFQILLENRTSRFSVKRQPSRTLVSFLHPRLHIAQDLYSWSSRLCRAGTKQGEHSMTRTRSRDGNSKSMWLCKIYTGGAIVCLQPLKYHAPIIGVAHPLCRQIWRWKSRCNLPGSEAGSGQWEQTVEFAEGKKLISCLVSIGPAWLQGFWGGYSNIASSSTNCLGFCLMTMDHFLRESYHVTVCVPGDLAWMISNSRS